MSDNQILIFLLHIASLAQRKAFTSQQVLVCLLNQGFKELNDPLQVKETKYKDNQMHNLIVFSFSNSSVVIGETVRVEHELGSGTESDENLRGDEETGYKSF